MISAIPPLAAEPIFQIGHLPVTNSYINSSITVLLFAILAIFVYFGMKKYYSKNIAPKGLLNFIEMLFETMYGYFDQVTGDRKKTIKFLPIVGSFFFFILLSNWMGLLPGINSIYRVGYLHGELERLPIFRPANTDLNMTVAMALVAVMASHILGVATIGFWKYFNKFIKVQDLWNAIASFNPVKLLVAFIEFFVGLIEIFSEVAKMVSLSLRLYGNIFAGEVLLTVIASLIQGYGAYGIPLPFMALELIVGLIQAVVFSMLTLVYLNMATTDVHGHGEEEHEVKESLEANQH
jgi:F-type H+-transporting ATPase subunit a